MVHNFSFLVPRRLAGSGRPGLYNSLREDLAQLSEEGIGSIVSLTERGLERELLAELGFTSLHLSIHDFMPPTLEQMIQFLEFTREQHAANRAVLAHCHAGIGRTGTMLAVFKVSEGLTAPEAIQHVRERRRGSIETLDQERAVQAFEEWFRGADGNK